MLTITIFAAGLVCLAGVLGLRLGRAQTQVATATAGTARAVAEPTADERGITLQTLIVTAVLVLMAVAAGVVIVAITNNASEDLERASSDIESRCEPFEVFDPVLAARNDRGVFGYANKTPRTIQADHSKYAGSAAGCVPACFKRDSVFIGSAIYAYQSTKAIVAQDSKFEVPRRGAYDDAFTSGTPNHMDPDKMWSVVDSDSRVAVDPSNNYCQRDIDGDGAPEEDPDSHFDRSPR